IVVENVMDCEFPDLNGNPGYLSFAGHLPVAAFHGFLLPSESDRLPQKQPRRVVMRVRKVRLLSFAVGETGRASGGVQAEALQQLGIVVELAAVPNLEAEKGAGAPGLSRLRPRRKAVRAEIGRAKRRIALLDIGGLSVDLPVGKLGLRRGEVG